MTHTASFNLVTGLSRIYIFIAFLLPSFSYGKELTRWNGNVEECWIEGYGWHGTGNYRPAEKASPKSPMLPKRKLPQLPKRETPLPITKPIPPRKEASEETFRRENSLVENADPNPSVVERPATATPSMFPEMRAYFDTAVSIVGNVLDEGFKDVAGFAPSTFIDLAQAKDDKEVVAVLTRALTSKVLERAVSVSELEASFVIPTETAKEKDHGKEYDVENEKRLMKKLYPDPPTLKQ